MSKVNYKAKQSIQVVKSSMVADNKDDKFAILKGVKFKDGEIELWLSGQPRKDAHAMARGFVGFAFRISPDKTKFEAIYLRPTNARANDQLRRNRTIQYISSPNYPWFKLRQENPGQYEAYTDLVPGEWTKYRLVVKGKTAKLYVNGQQQPSLIVNDLKLGDVSGNIGLWIGPGTLAHFSGLKVTHY
ncbi:family 16 glycoside hydrolase [Agaribacter flavus]|uniref:Family 16 glycoside hydrolase n=1 Tax=Agaribacter flavus TaxID=1902781 RepID=A0ABV7FM06_9ALTE